MVDDTSSEFDQNGGPGKGKPGVWFDRTYLSISSVDFKLTGITQFLAGKWQYSTWKPYLSGP
jgi:hypothetical protein